MMANITQGSKMEVSNHDIVSLVRRIRRFRSEVTKSVSSGVSEFSDYDKNRLESYLVAVKDFKSWMVSQPNLDMPETNPMVIEIGETPEVTDMENDDLLLIANLFSLIEKELVNSQSARRGTGLISHDSARFDSYIKKIELFITDYIAGNTPLDLPESSPMVASTGHGRSGI